MRDCMKYFIHIPVVTSSFRKVDSESKDIILVHRSKITKVETSA
jgi:hypothetical protein